MFLNIAIPAIGKSDNLSNNANWRESIALMRMLSSIRGV